MKNKCLDTLIPEDLKASLSKEKEAAVDLEHELGVESAHSSQNNRKNLSTVLAI